MSEPKPVPRLVQVAIEGFKPVARIDVAALPGATTSELLDARDWLDAFARANGQQLQDLSAIDEEIARRPFDHEGDQDVECAAEDVAREMLMDEICDFSPRELLRFLRSHGEIVALVKAVAEGDQVPPLVRQRASCALEALGGPTR